MPFIAPDGTTGDIPIERAADAVKAGFKQATTMISPDGKVGYIPNERVADASKAGFQDALKNPEYMLKQAQQQGAASSPNPINADKTQVSPTGERLGGRIATDPDEIAAHRKTEQEIGDAYATGVGLLIPGAGVEGGLGKVATTIARVGLGGAAGSAIGEHYGGTPGAIAGGIIGGGLAGGLERSPASAVQSQRGIPGSVKSLPFGIQKAIPEWMVPKGEVGSPTNPGPFSNIPARVKPPVPETPTPFQGTKLSDLMQPNASPQTPAPTPAQLFAQRQATARAAKEAAAESGSGDSSTGASGSPDDLISRTRALVKPGEEPTAADIKRAGDLTQAPLEKLKQLAKWGDRLAQNEINRRLKNP
jgi:hypothetical protein